MISEPIPWRAAHNLRSQDLWLMDTPPWECKSPRPKTLTSKAKFRAWQQNEDTMHVHFTLVEPVNPNLRIQDDNPALCFICTILLMPFP